eukprot:GHVN01059645.1.p1 GENE.GHVN01059645.1~~GHVN01059645.1.p1  ORF type:complete len:177 (+),score=11.74 GHVN01059645.1:33-533(+)
MTHEESPQFMNKWKKNPEPQLIPPEQYEDSSKSFHIVPRIRPWQKVKMVKDEKTGKEAEVRVPVPFFDNPSLRRFLGFIIVAYIGFGYYLGPVAWLYYLIRMIYTRTIYYVTAFSLLTGIAFTPIVKSDWLRTGWLASPIVLAVKKDGFNKLPPGIILHRAHASAR